MNKSLAALVGTLAFAFSFVARADVPPEWKDCKKEIGKYCKGATENQAIMDCIEAREQMGKKGGLSKKCLAAHEKLESPEKEKSEKHEGGGDETK